MGSDGDPRFRRMAAWCAVTMFAGTSLLAWAGADWPPPPGILWLEGILGVLALTVYFRVAHRLTARSRGGRLPSAALEGAVAAIVAGAVVVALHSGDPDITPTPRDHLVWVLVLGLAGAAAAELLWRLALRAAERGSPGSRA